jgi:glycosyltransferase involved in cell wall biosynthesis
VEGETGFICQPRDATDLARAVGQYFSSELFRDLERRREEIKRYANERYSWTKVAEITRKVYEKLNAPEGR